MVGRAGGVGGPRRPLNHRVAEPRVIRAAGTRRTDQGGGRQRSRVVRGMRLFLNSHRAKLDKKGRVSFPAEFRAALDGIDSRTFYLRPHHMYGCVEGLSQPKLDALSDRLNQLDDYSEEAENLRLTLFGDTAQITYDAEGRFSMPQNLIDFAGLGESLVFTGMGDVFQIWEEQALERRKAEARQKARDNRLTVPGTARPPA